VDTNDDRVPVPIDSLSLEEIGHAGVKDISEIRDYRFRQEGDHTIHTMNLGMAHLSRFPIHIRVKFLGPNQRGSSLSG
jgi:hypothetical protein